MAKVAKTVGIIAGAVALVATGVGAFAVAGTALAATAASVATAATLVSGVSSIAASALASSKPPAARGSITDVTIRPDARMPYAMGEGYFGGAVRYQVGYGPTLNDVPNPYFGEVTVYSGGGPIEGPITPQFDFANVSPWYNSFFAFDSQLGATPEATALVPPYGAPMPNWGANHRLSGQAAVLWNHLFDKDGERYASGLPNRGVLAKWVKAYDPRKDSTFPGGAGAHRLGDESTYEWSENPALHAGTYAYGRFQSGKRVLGMGLPVEAIRFDQIATWANDCDANGWTIFGVCFEPDDRWANLRDICAAGGGEPVPLHTGIGFDWDRPRVVLDTITQADVMGDVEITGMQSYRDRLNTIVPRYMSPAHNWELITADPIVGSTYLAEDGEERREAWPFNFVKNGAQAGQLAAYRLANSRELYPITIPCHPRMRAYRPGDCLQIEIQDGNDTISTPAVIVNRQIDPVTLFVTLTFIGETTAKHAYALGETAVPPPSPVIGQTSQERDELAATVIIATDGVDGQDGAPGADGADGAPGPQGQPGVDGVNGAPGAAGSDGQTSQVHIAYADSSNGALNFSLGPPSGQTYFGTYTDFTVADSTNPADYEWNLYGGPATFGLINDANTTIGTDWVEKTGGISGQWDASAYSAEAFIGGAAASCTSDASAVFMLALNTDPLTNASFNTLDYAIFNAATSLQVYEFGARVYTDATPLTSGESLQVHYDGATVRYYRNGTVIRSAAAAADQRFFLDTSIRTVGDRISGIKWAAAGKAGTDGSDGTDGNDGAPGTDGNDGAPGLDGNDGAPGTDGDDGEDAIVASPPSVSFTLASNFAGVVNTGELPKAVQFTVRRGATDITSAAGTVFSFTPTNASAVQGGANGSLITVNGVSADTASVSVTVTVDGVVRQVPIITLTKARAGSAANSQIDNSLTPPVSTSYAAVNGGPLTIFSGTDGTLTFSAEMSYFAQTGTSVVSGKFQTRNSDDGVTFTSWADVAAETTGSLAGTVATFNPGLLTLSETVNLSGQGKFYQARLQLRISSGNLVNAAQFVGDFGFEWS